MAPSDDNRISGGKDIKHQKRKKEGRPAPSSVFFSPDFLFLCVCVCVIHFGFFFDSIRQIRGSDFAKVEKKKTNDDDEGGGGGEWGKDAGAVKNVECFSASPGVANRVTQQRPFVVFFF